MAAPRRSDQFYRGQIVGVRDKVQSHALRASLIDGKAVFCHLLPVTYHLKTY